MQLKMVSMQMKYRVIITVVLCVLFGLVYLGVMGAFQALHTVQSHSALNQTHPGGGSATPAFVDGRVTNSAAATPSTAYSAFVVNRAGLYVFALLAVPLLLVLFAFFLLERWYRRACDRAIVRELHVDPLTGGWNRRAGERDLVRLFYKWRATGKNAAIYFLDIDDFKAINDMCGHHVGDCVLQQVVSQIESLLCHTGKIYRWGGEEFLIICEGLDPSSAHRVGEALVNAVAEAFNPSALPVTASAGMTLFQETDMRFDQALKRADRAMYYAKSSGKNRLVDYAAFASQTHGGW